MQPVTDGALRFVYIVIGHETQYYVIGPINMYNLQNLLYIPDRARDIFVIETFRSQKQPKFQRRKSPVHHVRI